MPTSLPTVRATIRRPLATPWTSPWVAASSAALTGGIASPMPVPTISSGAVAQGLCRVSRPHRAIRANPMPASAIPAAATTPAGARCVHQPPTTAPSGSPTRKPDEHERGQQLGLAVDRDPSEDRDVDQGGDQRAAGEEADHHRPPGRGRAQRARRHQRVADRRVAPPERVRRNRTAQQQPRTRGRDHVDLGIGGGEGDDDPTQGGREQDGAEDVDSPQHEPPALQVEQGSRRGDAPRTRTSTARTPRRPGPWARASGCRRRRAGRPCRG